MEEREWWMDSEAVVFTADWVVFTGGTGAEVLDLFQNPWDYDWHYEQARKFVLDSIEDQT